MPYLFSKMRMMFSGSDAPPDTATRSADDISRSIDFVGGALDAQATNEGTTVSCSALSKDAPLCLDLLSDVLLHPSFPESEMGDVLFALVNLSRHQGLDAEGALRGTIDRFTRRFGHVAGLHGVALDPLNRIGQHARNPRGGRVAMQSPHLPAAPQQCYGDLSPDTPGDADDQGCSSRTVHIFSPVSR